MHRVQVSGLGVWDLWNSPEGLWLSVKGLGLGVQGLESRATGLRYRVWVLGSEFKGCSGSEGLGLGGGVFV
jgi:hypothetical protein